MCLFVVERLGAYCQTAEVDSFLQRRRDAQRLQLLKRVKRHFVRAEVFTLLRQRIQSVTVVKVKE